MCYGKDTYLRETDSVHTVPKRHVCDTCQKDHSDEEIHCTIPNEPPFASDLERSEITEAMADVRGEFIRASVQLVLENEHLTGQVLERIRAAHNVQKH